MQNKLKKISFFLLVTVVLTSCFLSGCKSKEALDKKTDKQSIFTVDYSETSQQLAFSGTISPISNVSVTSPFDGNVKKLFFTYGQMLKVGDPLLTLSSTDLEKSYQSALQGFLTAKQDFAEQQNQMQGTEILYKSGLIARNNYMQDLDQLQTAQLTFIMARLQLEMLLTSADANVKSLQNLSINEIPSVAKALSSKVDQLTIKAADAGIALFPQNGSSYGGDNGDSTPGVKVGDSVKQGQPILLIGNMSGIKLNISVDEMSINQLKVGLPITVTSPAFQGTTLNGSIDSISYQADPSSSGGLPTFAVSVVVPKITPDQRKLIHVGMNAEVQINIDQPQKIQIPIAAVNNENGQATVELWDSKTQKSKSVPITAGSVGEDSVEVLSGLKPGDKIVVNHQN